MPHSRRHHYPTSQCVLDGDILTVTPKTGLALRVPLSEIESIGFSVGNAANRTWHDHAWVGWPPRRFMLTSAFADPRGIREGRQAYRRLVKKLIKQTRARNPHVLFYAGPPRPSLRSILYALGGVSAVFATVLAGLRPELLVCSVVPLGFLFAGYRYGERPPPPLDPDTDLDAMLPPRQPLD